MSRKYDSLTSIFTPEGKKNYIINFIYNKQVV